MPCHRIPSSGHIPHRCIQFPVSCFWLTGLQRQRWTRAMQRHKFLVFIKSSAFSSFFNVQFTLSFYPPFHCILNIMGSKRAAINDVGNKYLPILRGPAAAHNSGALRLFSEFNFLLLFLVTASWSNKSRKSFLINKLSAARPMSERKRERERKRRNNILVSDIS